MAKPAMIGTVNGFVQSRAWIGGKSFAFDGTTLGLVKAAVALGAKDGTVVDANYGGFLWDGARRVTIISAPHDDRAGGFWANA